MEQDHDASSSVEKQIGVEVIKIVEAERVTGTKASYNFEIDSPKGLEIGPNQAVVIKLPQEISESSLRTIILQHRKDGENRWYPNRSPRRYTGIRPDEVKTEDGVTRVKSRTKGWLALDANVSHLVNKGGVYNERDSNPAKTKIYAYDDENERWELIDTKIGEPRPAFEPEEERLHDLGWRGSTSKIMLVGAGEGDPQKAITNLHRLEIVTNPEVGPDALVREHIFTRGVHFPDIVDGKFVGRESSKSYPKNWGYDQSIQIGAGDREIQPFPVADPSAVEEKTHGIMYVEDDKIHIPLTEGRSITSLEVAAGDTVYGKSGKNSNKAGWARLRAFAVDKSTQKVYPIIDSESIPPQGILSGAPLEKANITDGEIIIESQAAPSWVMGVRLIQE